MKAICSSMLLKKKIKPCILADTFSCIRPGFYDLEWVVVAKNVLGGYQNMCFARDEFVHFSRGRC